MGNYRNFDNFPGIYSQWAKPKGKHYRFCIWIYVTRGATYEASANDEISIIATAFMTSEPKYGVNIGNIYNRPYIR